MYTGSVVGVHPTGHPSEKMICRVSGVALTRTAVAFARVVFSNDYYKLYKLSLPGKCNIMGLKLTYWESIWINEKWLSMVTFKLIMDDHYDLPVFEDDLDGGMGWLLFVVDWIISPFPTFSTNKTMRPGRWQEIFVADLEKMDIFFPHMSILLVIGKIMNFQSPTYPKLQLVPPTAISAISSAPRWGWTAGRCTTQFPNLII